MEEQKQSKDVEELTKEYQKLEAIFNEAVTKANKKMYDLHSDVDEGKTDPNHGLVATCEKYSGSFLGTISELAQALNEKKQEVLNAVEVSEDVVKIGDIIEYEILNGDEFTADHGKIIPTVTGITMQRICDEKLISILGPIGSALYGKPVGTQCTLANGSTILLSGIIKKDSLTEEERIVRIKEN